jgi:hypothetical protein
MLGGAQKNAGLGCIFLFLLLLCCKQKEETRSTAPPAPPPAAPTDVCGAKGSWRFSCPAVDADEACGIRTIGKIENTFTISEDIALSGGSWMVGENKYTFDRTTCDVSGVTTGMPCSPLRHVAHLRTGRGENAYGCWSAAKKCQALWSSKPGHCTVTKE